MATRPYAEGVVAQRVAVFGGSFNPPHVGHVLAVSYLLSVEPLEGVLVVPVARHAFGKVLAPFEDRLEMCRRAMEWLPGVEVSAIEAECDEESRTLRTVEQLKAEQPERSLRLVIGADVLAERTKWHRFERIAELAPPLVLGRAGHPHPEAPPPLLPEVSSSLVRRLLAAREFERVAPLLPHAVLSYIRQHGLYRSQPKS